MPGAWGGFLKTSLAQSLAFVRQLNRGGTRERGPGAGEENEAGEQPGQNAEAPGEGGFLSHISGDGLGASPGPTVSVIMSVLAAVKQPQEYEVQHREYTQKHCNMYGARWVPEFLVDQCVHDINAQFLHCTPEASRVGC